MKQRIEQLEKEIQEFDYKRLTCQEKARQFEIEIQQEMSQISEGILTRKGEVIGLKRLLEKSEKED